MHTCAIVNPTAGGGRVRRVWPRLLSRLLDVTDSLSVRWTTGPDAATTLTRRALKEGTDRIVAVGGDGTLHEVVNGFFENQTRVAPAAVLAVVACGSGSDFRRTLGAPTGVRAGDRLRSDRIVPLDVLRVEHPGSRRRRAGRYAINIASAGLSGTVVRRFSGGRRLLPPRLRYLGTALRALAADRPASVRLTLDGAPLPMGRVRLVVAANGHTFAAGLPIAPTATPQDGLLDLVVLRDMPVPTLLRHAHRFYRGAHTALAGVDTYRGRRLTITPTDSSRPVWTEADGEAVGRLPMNVEVVPRAIRVQY
jgi:YegS/Rv2252/BmrU family lipid kinase